MLLGAVLQFPTVNQQMSPVMDLDLDSLNQQLRDQSPADIIRWAASLGEPMMGSTSFAPNAAVMLKLITDVAPETPIVWVDSGYNVPDTYRVAEKLIKRLQPNLQVYIPEVTAERRNALMGGIPFISSLAPNPNSYRLGCKTWKYTYL